MTIAPTFASGRFCWLDLAATDADRAKRFYADLFGWRAHEQPANGGAFTRLSLADCDVGSLYPLRRGQVERGVPSHWTPYVCVDDIEATVGRAVALGGQLLVQPFEVSGVARIALVADAVRARVGLWEPFATRAIAGAHG